MEGWFGGRHGTFDRWHGGRESISKNTRDHGKLSDPTIKTNHFTTIRHEISIDAYGQ